MDRNHSCYGGRDAWTLHRKELGFFYEAAEIFFAGDVFRPGFAGEAGVGFIFHFQTFDADHADELRVLLPDLALAKFHLIGWG